MSEAVVRHTVLIIGLFLAGMLCVLAAPAMISESGVYGPTIFNAMSPAWALIAALLGLLGATVVAIVAARLVNAAVGLFILGGGLFALDYRLGEFTDLVFAGGGSVVLESVLWFGIVLAATAAVFRFGGQLDDVEPTPLGVRPSPWFSRDAMISAGCGLLAIPVLWLMAQSPMKGQVLGSMILAGLVAGLVARLLAPHVQPVLVFATPVLFGGIGTMIGRLMIGKPLTDALVDGDLYALALPLPIDLAAGSLLGVSMGIGWARSFLYHEDDSVDTPSST